MYLYARARVLSSIGQVANCIALRRTPTPTASRTGRSLSARARWTALSIETRAPRPLPHFATRTMAFS